VSSLNVRLLPDGTVELMNTDGTHSVLFTGPWPSKIVAPGDTFIIPTGVVRS
jgi:hypothetical protein